MEMSGSASENAMDKDGFGYLKRNGFYHVKIRTVIMSGGKIYHNISSSLA